jgi:hypothetical protein
VDAQAFLAEVCSYGDVVPGSIVLGLVFRDSLFDLRELAEIPQCPAALKSIGLRDHSTFSVLADQVKGNAQKNHASA